jgi:hypothetical protein
MKLGSPLAGDVERCPGPILSARPANLHPGFDHHSGKGIQPWPMRKLGPFSMY